MVPRFPLPRFSLPRIQRPPPCFTPSTSPQPLSGSALLRPPVTSSTTTNSQLPALSLSLCTKDSNGQVTACVERCCACRHRHSEVWPRPGSDTAWGTSLARRPRPGCFSSWQWQFTGVWTAAHRRTCRTTAFWPPVSTLGSTCVPPTVNCLQYPATGSTLTAVEPF